MTTELTWQALQGICRGLQNAELGETWKGRFPLASAEEVEAINTCLTHFHDTGLEASPPRDAVGYAVGEVVDVSFLPRIGFAVVAADMDGYLTVPQCRIKAKKRFFLVDVQSASTDTNQHDHVRRYMLVLKLVKSLRDAAAFLDEDEQALVFISDGRFDIPVRYTLHDLKNLDVDAVEALTTLVPSDTHKKQCGGILATAIVELVRAQPPESRFSYLLENAQTLRVAYEQGYKLYAAGFSYEKLKDTVETARVEYVAKIHKVFSDIQNQLLGIPVATIVVATQMKFAGGVGTEFFVNTAVLLGCWVFAVITILLLRNQAHTLKVISDEIARQQRVLVKDYPSIASTFDEPFAFLKKRTRAQRVVLLSMDAVVVVGLCLSHVVYFFLTPFAWPWMVALLTQRASGS